jgi:ketosteroid isomerase-like protein
MASENVELVRSIRMAAERGDFNLAEWAHPEIEFVIADGPDPGTYKGRVEMERAMRDWLSTWEEYRFKTEEYRELDDERVLAITISSGRGKSSGARVGQTYTRGANLVHVRGGKVTRLVSYWKLDNALADLGLKE